MSERRLPSLTRRVAATVVLTFGAVFVLLFVWIWHEAMGHDSGEVERGLMKTASGLAALFDHLDTAEQVQTALATLELLQRSVESPSDPPVLVAAARLSPPGQARLGTPPALDWQHLAPGASTQADGGRRWRVYVAEGERWRVAIFDDEALRAGATGAQLARDLLLYLGLALPVVMLPVWWMVRRLLAPLAALSAAVAARDVHDMRPLPAGRGRWRELVPLEQALNRLFERVAQGMAREKAFVHDAAHELRTPLAAIATQAHGLGGSAEPAQREQAVARLDAAVQRASHLVQQLLDLARADSVAASPREDLDLMNLVRDAMSLLAERANAQGTELELEGPDHLRLRSDARALRSIVDNLLDNALRYGGPGGMVQVGVRWRAGADASRGEVELAVADSGPGIAAEEQVLVFERFGRGAAAHDQPGTGLGLAIVREAARALGGDVRLADARLGATFIVCWPAAAAPVAAASP
jgi:signal transduction histidine kinase